MSSAGSSALRTDTNATIDAMRSIAEWIASLAIATDPVIAAAAIFSAMSAALDAMDTPAALVLLGRRSSGRAGAVLIRPPARRAAHGLPRRGG